MCSIKKKYKLEAGSVRRKSRGSPETTSISSKSKPSRVARMLALAHYVERLVESGTLRDYAHSSRILGITRARMTQIEGLLLLAPSIQEQILVGIILVSERQLRRTLGSMLWEEQKARVGLTIS